MAIRSKKDMLIEDAQKLAARGQFDKAAKVYEQILALEPGAINLRQKLAELLIKCGSNDDARKELEVIGKHFSKNGFYLKAIAVYKQLQKLFPADISLSIILAELNAKHGLIANSLSEYKFAYEYYEKAGSFPETIGILDRMQNVDPQSLPIKVKLAEAYAQYGKKEESYAVFSKTASLLLERGDSASLSKIVTRIHQLFPEKPDFMLEALAEQIRQGNAASAVECIQNLLRSNPNNNRAWDLIIQAYQQLEQPQRVKVACQHYLKFFPSEPEAMYGLISSIIAEQDLAGALELLDKYEAALITAGYLQQLEQIYHSLEKIDPINIKVLEGFVRVATAVGNDDEICLLTSKLKSLRSVGGVTDKSIKHEFPTALIDEQPLSAPKTEVSPAFDYNPLEQAPNFFGNPESVLSPETLSSAEPAELAAINAVQQPEDEIEIDVEFDVDSPFASLDEGISTASEHGEWLASIGELFDAIDTAPRGVKFGNEMEGSDAQSHFDLGQAFKEMGLYDEAINEFRQASQDASRCLECLIMQCACLRERGEVEKAIKMLLALLKPGQSEDESCAIEYELATGYEAAGKIEEAKILLLEIYAMNPGFRDISSRLNAASLSDTLDFTDEDLDDFGLK